MTHGLRCCLKDAEAEVRAAAAKNLSGYISIIKSELFTSEILPLLSALSQDTAPNVRSTCCSSGMGVGETCADTV